MLLLLLMTIVVIISGQHRRGNGSGHPRRRHHVGNPFHSTIIPFHDRSNFLLLIGGGRGSGQRAESVFGRG